MASVDENAIVVRALFGAVLRLMRAGSDRTQQEAALMEAHEAIKDEIDRRCAKFTDDSKPGG